MTKIYSITEARRLVADLTQDLVRLDHVVPRTFAEYETHWDKIAIVERLFTRLVNYAIDINQFILVAHNLTPPTNYYQTFLELARLKILPSKLAHDLAQGTAVRNRLEHEYDRIDHLQVYTYVQKTPRRYRSYVRHIKQWLDDRDRKK